MVIREKGSLRYMKFGSGEKVFVILPGLSIHSVLNSASAISEAYKAFGEEYTVYLFERPDDIAPGCSLYDIAASTASAFQSLAITSADIFGASQGGMIALSLLLDYPALCNRVILGSALSRPNDIFLSVTKRWIDKAVKRDEEGLLESFVECVYSKNTVEKFGKAIIEANRGITDEEYEHLIILASSSLSFDVSKRLKEIKTPVLVLGSEGDRVVTGEASREIAKGIGCGCFIYPPFYGHAVYDEAPDYRKRMLDFLHETEK